MVRAAYKIATVWGIPIRLHVTMILVLPVMVWDFGLVPGVVLAVGLFTSIVLHELGHSLVAIRTGCRVREILLLPIGGAAQMESMPRRPLHEFIMAIAGPAVSLGLFGLLVYAGAYLPLPRNSPLFGYAGLSGYNIAQELGFVNLGLASFNMLPAFPMDGGRVLRALLSPRLGRLRATRIAARVGRVMAVLFAVAAIWLGWREHIMLFFIAGFVFWAAGAEYRLVRMQEMRNVWDLGFRPPPPPGSRDPAGDDEVTVSPSPYRQGPEEHVPIRPVRRRGPFDFSNGAGP